jgi:outer membrane protein OmpA-like peptidoglycan-associated protein
MKLRSALLASAMMALPFAAANAQVTGPYISLGAGVNIMQDETIKTTLGVPVHNDLETNLGAVGVLAGGWGFGNGLRAELEFDYRYNGLNKINGPGGGSISGWEEKYGPMVNVAYDFVGLTPWFTPYIGAGVGYQWVPIKVEASGGASSQHTAGNVAAQAILGAAMPIPSVAGLSLTAEYRFLAVLGDRTYSAVKLGDDLNHSVLIGLRYEFGVPPPPAPMPVSEVGAKTFLVFFDWDRADLTARSQAIVHDAADYSRHTQYTRIDVDGNTDTSGTPQYNMGLSERRARVVASELVRDGVPQNAISMHAYGDTKLLVPTGPGVREPQNRRVEIVYH